MGVLRITVKADSQTRSFQFDKDTLIIGEGLSDALDIPLPGLGLTPDHVKICRQAGRYYVLNQANDPFVTLNGLPFFKKTLKEGDVLLVRDAEIHIDGCSDETAPVQQPAPIVKEKTEPEKAPDSTPAFEDISTLEIESFLGDVQQEPDLIFKPPTSVFTQRKEKRRASPKETFGMISLKDDTFHENEEELKPPSPKVKPPRKVQAGLLKVFIWGFILLLGALGVVASEMYLRLTSDSIEDEMFAAEGVADIAMALTYAQLHQVNPASQNWSDPEFLRNNLLAILSPTSLSSRSILSSSQSSTAPYILRIYTSYDLARFLVVAQPTPSFNQIWVPKHAIIVDSGMMVLRKTADFKALNRFLAYPNPLDESHNAELDQLLANSSLIHLSDLAKVLGNQEFVPPKALGYLRPGAEDRIYNAPRYHEFGDAVLLHAVAHNEAIKNGEDDQAGNGELEKLAKLGNFVLYIPEKLTLSPNASNLFSSLPIEGKFLLGYLNLSNDGKIKSSHLMMQSDQLWNRDAEVSKGDIALAAPPENAAAIKSPLEQELERLAASRKEKLSELKNKIAAALDRQISSNDSAAIQEANELIKTYDLQTIEQSLIIKKGLEALRQQYKEIPSDDFYRFAKQAGLGAFLEG